MSIHKLTAGAGYDYLTRQVAAQDVTERGHGGLAAYYSAKGEAPGVWVGSGMAGLDGLAAGDPVTQAQMRNLFGAGKHPLAEQLRRAAAEAGLDAHGQDRAAWLGTPFPVYPGEVSLFRRSVAARVAELNTARGLPADAPCALEDRARIRTEVAVELFRAEHGRDPADAREIAATIARHSRPRTTAVAGYDLTFSPVKSVSTLVGDRRPRCRGRHRGRPRQGRRRRPGLAGAGRAVHPGGPPRGPPGADPRDGRRGVHPPRLPRRRPRPAHPRRGRQQGPDPGRRTVAGDRRTACCSRRPSPPPRPTTPPWNTT